MQYQREERQISRWFHLEVVCKVWHAGHNLRVADVKSVWYWRIKQD